MGHHELRNPHNYAVRKKARGDVRLTDETVCCEQLSCWDLCKSAQLKRRLFFALLAPVAKRHSSLAMFIAMARLASESVGAFHALYIDSDIFNEVKRRASIEKAIWNRSL